MRVKTIVDEDFVTVEASAVLRADSLCRFVKMMGGAEAPPLTSRMK